LMSILSAKAVEKNEAQAEFVQRCHDLASTYRIHIILVLHPNKEYRKGQDLEFEQISGTSDLSNRADNIISINREYDPDIIAQTQVNGKIAILKNRYYSTLGECKLHYDIDTGQLVEWTNGTWPLYRFGWEKYLSSEQTIAIEPIVKEVMPW